MARQGGLILLSSLQSLHVREVLRHKVQVCVSLLLQFCVPVCVHSHFIIRNVISVYEDVESVCAFHHVMLIQVCMYVCVCLY